MIHSKRHEMVVELAKYCTCSVINGLTDFAHPCQAMADLFTIREQVGILKGHTVAWVGDANNVARSLALGCGKVGMRFAMATPEKYQFDQESLDYIKQVVPDLEMTVTTDPASAVADAVAVYTDVWTSMGQEAEAAKREAIFRPYQLNAELMQHAKSEAIVLHCLPAHRGLEITDEVMDGPQSYVFDEAENRLHVQRAILSLLVD